MRVLEFVAYGQPVQQGSKTGKAIPNGSGGYRALIYEDAGKALKPWRRVVTEATRKAVAVVGGWAEDRLEPLKVTIVFVHVRPKSSKRLWPTVKPDIDKTIRAVLDAVTKAGGYADDCQVVNLECQAEYGPVAGIRVLIGSHAGAPLWGLDEGGAKWVALREATSKGWGA